MHRRLKQYLLIMLAVGVGVVAYWPSVPQRQAGLWAQGNSPLPTFTFPPTITPTPTITPLVSPTPTKVKRVVNEVTEPVAGDAIAGITRIVGTAVVPAFLRYDLHLSPAGMENWQWLVSSFEVVHDDVLYQLDTRAFPDGLYDLRVRALDTTGNYTEAFVRGVEIRNANPPTLTPAPSGVVVNPPSPLVTPTPTVDVSSRVPGGQGFYAPDNGAVIRGAVAIVATANGTPDHPYTRHELYLSPAGQENWQLLDSSTQQAWQEPIYVLDTTALPDGLVDLRLRIVYRDANYNEYFLRNLSVANVGYPTLAVAPPAGISLPRSGTEVAGVVEFRGTVPAANLLRWEMAWSPSESEQWQFLVSAEQPVDNGVLARLDLSQLPNGLYDFRLRVVRGDSNYTDYIVRGLRLHNPGN